MPKDSLGMDYDGWVLKNSRGRLMPWTFRRTRALALKSMVPSVAVRCKAIKVRLVEVQTEVDTA